MSTEPMSDENLAELRGLHERATRDFASELHYRRLAFHVWLPDLLDEVERVRAGEKRVRDLHAPVTGLPGTGGPVCRHCVTYDGQTVLAPCPTMRALDRTEAGR